jgi:hypothetical protein
MAAIEERKLKDWSEYLEIVIELERDYQSRSRPPLFRGLANSKWGLETSLERYETEKDFQKWSFLDYYRQISLYPKSAIETLTGRNWNDFPDYDLVKSKAAEDVGMLDLILVGKPAIYELLIYFRHHGYPSPLLDWTASPYVAAFFAFDKNEEEIDTVAVYAFVWGRSGGLFSGPEIKAVGPFGQSHPRHFAQKCWYSWCVEKALYDYCILPHGDAITEATKPDGKIVKLLLPASERQKVLKELDLMNVNEYSLFNSEDSLVRTIARRCFMFEGIKH